LNNLAIFEKNKKKPFYKYLNDVIKEILLNFVKQKKEEKDAHVYFLFKLIFYLILDDETIIHIFNEVKKWRFTYKKNKWGDGPNDNDKHSCLFLNTSVDKMYYCIQVICRDSYIFNKENDVEELNNYFKINEYMDLMYFDVNPLDKYRYLVTLINKDSYYNHLREYIPNEEVNADPVEDFWLKADFTKLYNIMKSLGKVCDDEMEPIRKYVDEIKDLSQMNPNLQSAFKELFSKIFNGKNLTLQEIRTEMYKKEEYRGEEFKKKLTNKLEIALCNSSDGNWIKQMLFKIRFSSSEFEEYMITYLSLYFMNENTILHLIQSVQIHKAIKSILTNSLITLKFIYNLVKKSGSAKNEFFNKSVFLYISYVLNKVSFNRDNENKEKALYILKILHHLNKHTKYSIAKIGREVIKKMSEIYEYTPKIKYETNNSEKKVDNKNKNGLPLKSFEEEEKSVYSSSRGNENEESIELINVKKKVTSIEEHDFLSETDLGGDHLFISYLEYLTDFIYFHKEIKEHILNFLENNLSLIVKVLKTQNLLIKYKLIIIKFLTNFFTANFINHIEFSADEKFLQDYDFEGCIMNIENEVNDDDMVVELSRYQNIYEKILKIFLEEVRNINNSSYYIKYNCIVIRELAISVKKITDMFLVQSDEWINGSYYYVYKLALVFIAEAKTIFNLLKILNDENEANIQENLSIIKSKTFEWEKSENVSRVLSYFFEEMNKKDEFLTKKFSIVSYVKYLKKINTPINKTFYLETVEKLYLGEEKEKEEINKIINEKFKQYFNQEYALKKWNTFVESLKIDDTKMIYSFFNYFTDNFFFEDVTNFEKYKLFIKITHPQISKEIAMNKKKKRSLICFEIMNTLLYCNTDKMQNMLIDFLIKNSNLFDQFIKNLAIFLKEHLFLYIEDSFNENSKRLAINNQLLFDILDFLLRLKEDFCMDYVEYVLKEVLKNPNPNGAETKDVNNLASQGSQEINPPESIPINTKSVTRKYVEKKTFYSIYGIISQNFSRICEILEKTTTQNSYFPCERLIVLFYTLSKFLKEYLEGSRTKDRKFYFENINNCLINNLRFGLLFVNNPNKQKELILIKSQLLTLMTSIVFEFSVDFGKEIYLFFNENFNPTKIWREVVFILDSITNKLKIARLNKRVYIENQEFNSSPELELSFKFYIFLYYWKGKEYVENMENAIQFEDEEKEMNILKFLRKIVMTVECTMGETKENKLLFFPKPPVAFNLSRETMIDFEENAVRNSRDSKVESLVNYADLFLFEIYTYEKSSQRIGKLYNRFFMEVLNYIIVIIIQILLLVSFFQSPSSADPKDVSAPYFSFEQKFGSYTSIESMVIIQLVFCVFTFVIWFLTKFKLEFRRNYFVYKGQTILRMKDPLENALDIYNAIKKNLDNLKIPFFEQYPFNHISLKVLVLDTLFFNNQINVTIFSVILDIIYLSTYYSPCLVLQIFYICNLVKFLYFIILAAKKKWIELLSVLFFIYMTIYLFSWISFYHLSEMMTFPDALNDTVIYFNFSTMKLRIISVLLPLNVS